MITGETGASKRHLGGKAMLKIKNLGAKLRELRDKSQLSNNEFADATGVSRMQIYRYMIGDDVKKIRASTLRQITTSLNLDYKIDERGNITFWSKPTENDNSLGEVDREIIHLMKLMDLDKKIDVLKYAQKLRREDEQE